MRLPNYFNNGEVGGKIWIFWDAEFEFEMKSMLDQAVSGWFVHGNCRVLVTFVYASCFRRKRVEMWEFLKLHDACGLPWFILFGMILKRLVALCKQ